MSCFGGVSNQCQTLDMRPCRWQEERRRHFPSEANLAKRAEEAKARAERGELDPQVTH